MKYYGHSETNTFIQLGCIKMLKSVSEDNFTKDLQKFFWTFYSNQKCITVCIKCQKVKMHINYTYQADIIND